MCKINCMCFNCQKVESRETIDYDTTFWVEEIKIEEDN